MDPCKNTFRWSGCKYDRKGRGIRKKEKKKENHIHPVHMSRTFQSPTDLQIQNRLIICGTAKCVLILNYNLK